MSQINNIIKKVFPTSKGNKYNKIHVESSDDTMERIQKTKSKRFYSKFTHELNIRPSTVNVQEYPSTIVPKTILNHPNCLRAGPSVHTIICYYTSDLYEIYDKNMRTNYTLYYKNKPLTRRVIPLIEYDYKDFEPIIIRQHVLFGGSSLIPFKTSIYDQVTYYLKKHFIKSIQSDWALELIEDLTLYAQDMFVSMNSQYITSSVSCATLRFIKKRSGGSLCYKLAQGEFTKLISSLNFFHEQSFRDTLDDFKNFLDNYENIKDSKLLTNIKKLISYGVAFSLFDTLNIPLNFVGYNNFEVQMCKKNLLKSGKADFVHSILSSLHFLCERGYQYFITGDLSTIFHSSKEYSKLIDQVAKLRNWSKLLSNCEAHGFSESLYRSELDDSIESFQSVLQFNSHLTKLEKSKCRETLNELKMLRFDLTTIRASREHRDAPLGILINGDSGVGKSTIKDILFTHYGKIFNLPIDKTFCYTRNPVAKYWDGFVTSCWCVILDDIAFKHPNLGEDESCMEFLQINNSVPFVPDQAALEAKGRTPLRAKLVIGTTNTKHLNAHFYFSCASAAQRRFPYIITPSVKKEFVDDNGMLDTSKCHTEPGRYPNYWNFLVETVHNLKADPINLGRPAEIKKLCSFDDVDEFLQWYGQISLKFVENQRKVTTSIDNIQNIHVCKGCLNNEIICKCFTNQSQNDDDEPLPLLCTNLVLSLVWFILLLFSRHLAECFVRIMFKYSYNMGSQMYKKQFARAGELYKSRLGNAKNLKIIVSSITALGASYYIYTHIYKKLFLSEIVQSKTQARDGSPTPQERERENVWYNSNLELSSFNTTPTITSSKALTKDFIINKVGRNVYYVTVTKGGKRAWFRILCLKGNKYLMNNHSFSSFDGSEEITLNSSIDFGVNKNITIRLTEKDVQRYPDRDLCILTIKNINPGGDITKYFGMKSDLSKQNGFYITRQSNGDLYSFDGKLTENVRYDGSTFMVPALRCTIESPTIKGDCGMPFVLHTSMGYLIAGIHVSGLNHTGIINIVEKEFLDSVLVEIVPLEGEPMLDSQSAKMVLGDLHHKSVFNYIDAGCASVYGSFLGFRRKPKTSVEDTPLKDKLSVYGYEKKYTAPMMNGYLPFRIAALDMVNPVVDICQETVHECKEAFLQDILQSLHLKDIKFLVEPYNIHTAINGAPEVAYVDRMKVSTSAGNPWKCKKEKFLPLLNNGTDDRYCTQEIQHRVEEIIKLYKNNTRTHPIFCAHLKDEPVTFKKADIGKTRVFTGAPMDWTIVNRMYYLSLIRLIQNNKFAFETAVGTVAQSMEWFDLLNYLMRDLSHIDDEWVSNHRKEYVGKNQLENRFIAGDYKAFDKRMSPLFILEAFEILIDIAKLSENYTDEDIKIMRCIAYDTAYPTIDFNGDLVQFYGSNPSGHPLTVIINSLVNSLYIRYAYKILNPRNEINSFQKHVRLITYGDDNVMTSLVNWFNHTAISDALFKIGVTYTMADKEAKSVPFISMKEISFLKRSWVWNNELKTYLAPLEHDSIEKMLITWTRSKIAKEAQVLAIVESAVGEYFFYGKKYFNEKKKLLYTILSELGYESFIKKSTFPTWNQMKDRFRKSTIRAGIYMDEYEYSSDDGEVEMELEDYIVVSPLQSRH